MDPNGRDSRRTPFVTPWITVPKRVTNDAIESATFSLEPNVLIRRTNTSMPLVR